jgi:hypothetical protein
MKTRTLLPILLAVILIACAPRSLPILANLPTLTPQPTMSLTPETAYLPVTSTPQPSNTPDPTQSNLLAKYCNGSGYFFNSQWGICDLDSHKFVVFSITGVVWNYSYEELGLAVAGKDPEYDTKVIYTGNRWITYLVPVPRGSAPAKNFLGTGIALLKIFPESGTIYTLLRRADHFYSVSVSPTGRRMIVVEFRKPLKLGIDNLATGASSEIALEQQYDQAGEFVWSSNGLKLAYKLITNEDECTQRFTIRLLSFSDRVSTTRPDFLAKSSMTVVDDIQVNTCQSSDPMYYIDAVNDDFVMLKEGTEIHNIPIQPLQATAIAAARMTPLSPSATWTPFQSPMDNADAQQIAEVIIRSREIRSILACDPDSDVNMLNEAYADTSDFEMTPDTKLMVSTYIGNWAVEQAGYLTFLKAHALWTRSDDPYPRVDPDMATSAAISAQGPKGVHICPDILDRPILTLESIDLQENMAVVRYRTGNYQEISYEDILRRVAAKWYIVRSRRLSGP